MSLEMTIVMLIVAWLMVAGAMLWGVLRISRRHHPRPVKRQTANVLSSKTQQHELNGVSVGAN